MLLMISIDGRLCEAVVLATSTNRLRVVQRNSTDSVDLALVDWECITENHSSVVIESIIRDDSLCSSGRLARMDPTIALRYE